MDEINRRALISFDSECPYRCKHCFSYEIPRSQSRSLDQIVDSLAGETFDIVYISQKTENFVLPANGLELAQKVFNTYNCNIIIITRTVFGDEDLLQLVALHKKMQAAGKMLFVGISVIGLESSAISERLDIIPQPIARLDFAKALYCLGIPSLLMIRPLFPDAIIPSSEIEQIVDYVADNISCILTGPLMVNDSILDRLSINHDDLKYVLGGESEYLNGAMEKSVEFVDVLSEIEHLRNYCIKKNVPFFTHSMPALNYLLHLNSKQVSKS